MLLQLALDGTLDEAIRVLRAARPHVDIAEVGTPLIYREGVAAVRRLTQEFPGLSVLADLKIMDAGEEEAAIAFAAGAAWATVLGAAHDRTIQGAVAAARKHGGKICADLVQVADPLRRARELAALGVDLICLHTPTDLGSGIAGSGGLGAIDEIRAVLPEVRLAVAGGIGPATIEIVVSRRPAVVVIGGAIARSSDPAAAAAALRKKFP